VFARRLLSGAARVIPPLVLVRRLLRVVQERDLGIPLGGLVLGMGLLRLGAGVWGLVAARVARRLLSLRIRGRRLLLWLLRLVLVLGAPGQRLAGRVGERWLGVVFVSVLVVSRRLFQRIPCQWRDRRTRLLLLDPFLLGGWRSPALSYMLGLRTFCVVDCCVDGCVEFGFGGWGGSSYEVEDRRHGIRCGARFAAWGFLGLLCLGIGDLDGISIRAALG
jgi:hypothetical protein